MLEEKIDIPSRRGTEYRQLENEKLLSGEEKIENQQLRGSAGSRRVEKTWSKVAEDDCLEFSLKIPRLGP